MFQDKPSGLFSEEGWWQTLMWQIWQKQVELCMTVGSGGLSLITDLQSLSLQTLYLSSTVGIPFLFSFQTTRQMDRQTGRETDKRQTDSRAMEWTSRRTVDVEIIYDKLTSLLSLRSHLFPAIAKTISGGPRCCSSFIQSWSLTKLSCKATYTEKSVKAWKNNNRQGKYGKEERDMIRDEKYFVRRTSPHKTW